VVEHLAQRLVDHRNVRLAARAVSEFPLHHAKGESRGLKDFFGQTMDLLGKSELLGKAALTIEENAAIATPAQREPTPDPTNLVERLTAIRERLFWLAACFATTLSADIAYESDRYRQLFRELADELRKQDADALERITAGHEALLFAEPVPKPTLPLAAQQWFELAGEVRNTPSRRPPGKPAGYIPDGLQPFL